MMIKEDKKMSKNDFIKLWGEKALARYEKEKILPSLVICQAILESGWGTTDKAIKLNNFHGIKWYNDSICRPYPAVDCTTWEEYRKGEITNIEAAFCKFNDIDEELDCYYAWLHRPNPNYSALHGCTDAMKSFDLIDASPYATDTQYGEKLKRIYKQYILLIKPYDTKALKKEDFYRVQIGSFEYLENAKKLARKVKEQGYPVIIKNYGKYYRVQVGAFRIKIYASAMLRTMINIGYKDAYITTECGEDVSF